MIGCNREAPHEDRDSSVICVFPELLSLPLRVLGVMGLKPLSSMQLGVFPALGANYLHSGGCSPTSN